MKLVDVIADGLKLLGVSVKDDKFVAPNTIQFDSKSFEEVEQIMILPQMANLALITSIGDMMIKDEIKQLEGV